MTSQEIETLLIRPLCREQFSVEDLAFLSSILGIHQDEKIITQLLDDPDARDIMLDEPILLDVVLNTSDRLSISPRLYFFIILRRILLTLHVDNRLITDYTAELLSQYFFHPLTCRPSFRLQPLSVILQLIQQLSQTESEYPKVCLRLGVANLCLFLLGVYPERICQHKKEDRTPKLSYIEDLAIHHLHRVRESEIIQSMGLSQVLKEIQIHFRKLRLALNIMADYELFKPIETMVVSESSWLFR